MLVENSGPHIVRQLRERVEELEAKIQELKDALGVDHEYERLRVLGLTDNQAKLIGILLKREIASMDQLLTGLYIDHDSDTRYERVKTNIVVPLAQAHRRVLRGLGVQVENIHSYGYRIPPEAKARLVATMNSRPFTPV